MNRKDYIPDFSDEERNVVPSEFKWKVSDLYAKYDDWKKDKEKLGVLIDEIDIKKEHWTRDAKTILAFLDYITKIENLITKMFTYSSLLSDTDMSNPMYISDKGEIEAISVDFEAKISFLESSILNIGEEKIKSYIEIEKGLLVYKRFFDSIFRLGPHILDKEKSWIFAQTGLFSETAEKAASMLDNVDIPTPKIKLKNGNSIILNSANYIKYRQSSEMSDRRRIMKKYWENHAKFKNTFAVLLDSNVKKHLFASRIKRYSDTLTASLFPKMIDVTVYSNLIETVKSNLSPLHRYLKLKAELLKIKELQYGDIYASSIPAVNVFYSIEDAKQLLLNVLKPLGNEYIDVLKDGLENGWLDIYPNKNKRSGAYSQGSVYDTHPFVLMNYNGTLDSVSTLAHEFGHALHSYFSNKNQPIQTADYPIFLAEIASTFNEILLTHYLLNNTNNRNLKLYILDQYIEGIRGTLYRQTLFAEFEFEIHRLVENGKTLTTEILDDLYLSLTRLYYGHENGVLKVNDYIKGEWAGIPHFYYNYYVYQYSTGISASISLAEKVLNGNQKDIENYLKFLKAGNSDYPLNTLRKAGVDLANPQPIITAINNFENSIKQMEELI